MGPGSLSNTSAAVAAITLMSGLLSLIVEGKIKIKQGSGVKAVCAHSLVLEDGSELDADEIVFATGYQDMKETARKIFGDEVADRVKG